MVMVVLAGVGQADIRARSRPTQKCRHKNPPGEKGSNPQDAAFRFLEI
jgi:hypothetical protein